MEQILYVGENVHEMTMIAHNNICSRISSSYVVCGSSINILYDEEAHPTLTLIPRLCIL